MIEIRSPSTPRVVVRYAAEHAARSMARDLNCATRAKPGEKFRLW